MDILDEDLVAAWRLHAAMVVLNIAVVVLRIGCLVAKCFKRTLLCLTDGVRCPSKTHFTQWV